MEKILEAKVEKYFKLTSKALAIVKKTIIGGKEKEAQEIIEMVSNYLSDAKHFKEKNDLLNAFAALNYAHGWIDAGVRLEIFKVDDDTLFTIK